MGIKRVIAFLCSAIILFTCIPMEVNADVVDIEENVITEMKETVLYSSKYPISSAWKMGPSVYTTNGGGDFEAVNITEDGYFKISYTGTEGAVRLAFQNMNASDWIYVDTPTETIKNEDGSYTSTFSYEDCVKAYGSDSFIKVESIGVATSESTEKVMITNISWYGYYTTLELGETAVLYEGMVTSTSINTNMTFFFTKHVGGEWDASVINEGSFFYVEYTGEEGGIYLAFLSASGGTNWATVYPDETGINATGKYYSIYTYESVAKAYGTNFNRLDQIQVFSATSKEVTLRRILYFTGEGAPVDTSDATWDRPDTGIAFIGDSIVQNPLVDTSHLKGIDWNGILNREDCVNYGIGGQTTQECAARIDELAKKNYSKVVMLCGINDIGRGLTNSQIVDNYETMVEALCEKNPEIEIYIISVLPTTPAFYTGMQSMITALNTRLQAFALKYENVTYVDCHSSFVGEDEYCKDGLTFDGLHPNLTGYEVIAEILTPYLEEKEVEADTSTELSTEDETTDVKAPAAGNTDGSLWWILGAAAVVVVILVVVILIIRKNQKS